MSRSQRRAMIDREEPKLSLVRQCALLGISRSSLYYLPTEAGAEDLELMALIDQQYLKTPFYGSRRMTAWLSNHGHQVNRKRVRRLMQLIGLEAIYRRPNTSKPNPGHKVYPYLLRGLPLETARLRPQDFIQLRCQVCNLAVRPLVRWPRTRQQFLWGGWTCRGCGSELDRHGNLRT